MFLLCVVTKGRMQENRDKQVGTKYKQSTRENKRKIPVDPCGRSPARVGGSNLAGGVGRGYICAVCCRGIRDMRKEDIEVAVNKEDRKKERKESTNKNPDKIKMFPF